MRTYYAQNRQCVFLTPGEWYVSTSSVVMKTLLGPCVSACLYDPVHRVAGMNHFLLSSKRHGEDAVYSLTETGRYGIQAMELVINGMLKLGARRGHLLAKAFGGGRVLNVGQEAGSFPSVGAVNVRFIKEFLETEKIRLVASSLGGELGRVIRFDTDDFSVYMKNIAQQTRAAIDARDRNHWRRTIEAQEKRELDVEFW